MIKTTCCRELKFLSVSQLAEQLIAFTEIPDQIFADGAVKISLFFSHIPRCPTGSANAGSVGVAVQIWTPTGQLITGKSWFRSLSGYTPL